MVKKFEIAGMNCICSAKSGNDKIAYILYPMDILADWIEPASEKYGVDIVVITDMDWQNVFSPWPSKGVPKGSPDFKGESPIFLKTLQEVVIPKVEAELGYAKAPERTLVGVSMSGLFALWQWMECDAFANIASLSGSFWYDGFIEWIEGISIPSKNGKAFFLLGEQEKKSRVKAFDSVADNTRAIVELLSANGIKTEYEIVPGNHYSDSIPRLNKAFAAIYSR